MAFWIASMRDPRASRSRARVVRNDRRPPPRRRAHIRARDDARATRARRDAATRRDDARSRARRDSGDARRARDDETDGNRVARTHRVATYPSDRRGAGARGRARRSTARDGARETRDKGCVRDRSR